ncbi:MAG: hypothetical protein LBC74_03875 [Planctomycetaceae bacterium]|nr:hypothetical protein [Planctomycetaceae bacterium]
MKMNNKLFFVLAAVMLLFVGCSNNVELSGKITFSDDNNPLNRGEVYFETDNYFARGAIKPDGSYVVGSLSSKDGLPPGQYRVYISAAEKETKQKDEYGNNISEPLIDPKFTSGKTSGLIVDVSKTTKKFDFKVDRYVPQK